MLNYGPLAIDYFTDRALIYFWLYDWDRKESEKVFIQQRSIFHLRILASLFRILFCLILFLFHLPLLLSQIYIYFQRSEHYSNEISVIFHASYSAYVSFIRCCWCSIACREGKDGPWMHVIRFGMNSWSKTYINNIRERNEYTQDYAHYSPSIH